MSDLDLKGLFQKHAKALHSFLLSKSRDPHLAADLTQESFLRLAEQRTGERIDNSAAYLYRTASNLLIDHQRQQIRRKTDLLGEDVLHEVEAAGSSLDDITAASQSVERLQRAIAELPPRTQAIFRLNRIDGLTHAQVAQTLGISDSSVQKHLARALAHVMACLDDERA
ncbi:RNA polymerase sigma factor [Pseudomonas sp. GOM7]|uniref:RNA polymerase sigma factor n=1 Tax=unclassified Pseudomonas TaxID=196821 RepID=UPI00227B2E4D|nr:MULTISPECIES: RNA polymerase sigma factor [unclassified Pseudomonas]WAJ37543.1 RNA polymerase sigma factor [Pseudomonas sp. GOM7]